ncbi:MAG: ABC transporter ATP-binding protein [Hyphomicrobiaceae bacterium]
MLARAGQSKDQVTEPVERGLAPPLAGYLSVAKVSKSYRSARVLDALDLEVERGEIISLLGPSGCGKTTLLRAIAGLVSADQGTITLDRRDITRVPAHRRNVSVVFQSYALFPHLDVFENVAFGLRTQGLRGSALKARVEGALSMVRMDTFRDRSIGALSGGQQQRVAVARALVVEPSLVLLDEPFSALDRKLRETMQVELKSLLRSKAITAIFVTHDQEEALAVSDRIAVMNAGRIEQFADPVTLYEQPETSFVMEFVGLSTWLQGRVVAHDGEVALVETAHGRLRAPSRLKAGTSVVLAARPERISLGLIEPNANAISVRLQDVMCLGSKTHLYGETAGDDRILAEVSGSSILAEVAAGRDVQLSWPVDATRLYPRPAA